MAQPEQSPGPVSQKSRVVTGVLGILLGALGIHNFYVGRPKIGVAQLLISIVSLGMLSPLSGLWGLIEGIMYLVSKEPRWTTDGQGYPLAG